LEGRTYPHAKVDFTATCVVSKSKGRLNASCWDFIELAESSFAKETGY
jgi:hypothetical protein